MANMEAFVNARLPLSEKFNELDRIDDLLIQGDNELGRATLALAMSYNDLRKRGRIFEEKLSDLQIKYTKAEAEKNALTVKLKHARRQIEVEIQHRQKLEMERDDMETQIMLVRDLLFNNSDTNSCGLNEEQQKKLDFLNASRYQSPREGRKTVRRLERIDETGSFLSNYSDISFDYTEDDLDATHLRNGKKYNKRTRKAEQRAYMNDEAENNKKFKCDANEDIYINVDGPATVSVGKLEKSFHRPHPHQGRRRPSREHRRRSAGLTSESEAATSDDNLWPSSGTTQLKSCLRNTNQTPVKYTGKLHDMQIKPCVITKETCKPCGKRIQFGKKAMKCGDCRLVTHPECESQARQFTCDPSQRSPSTPPSPRSGSPSRPTCLEDFIISTDTAQIPPLIYYAVQEIENRGIEEQGIYRIPGNVKSVRELKEKFTKSKSIPDLTKVDEIHTLCSSVKEFLRETLPEPLLTFALYQNFSEAANKDTDAELYQFISELPQANRETLAYLMGHLQRVVDNKENCMTQEALSKAMGPSLVGYPNADPNMQQIQAAARTQERVMSRLLNLPYDFYMTHIKDIENTEPKHNYSAMPNTMLGPIGISPKKTPSSSSLADRAKKYLTPFGRSGKKTGNYFPSPVLK